MTDAPFTRFVGQITEPGVYDIPEADYHADPVAGGSLSCSGAKKLLVPSCPARFAWDRANPPEPSEAMNFGSAAHRVILGTGAPLELIDADSYRTKAAKEQRDHAWLVGCTPVLPREKETIDAMANALWDHPVAGVLLDRTAGQAEQALVWQDPESGVWCRSLVDFLPDIDSKGRLIVTDYKTCESGDTGQIARAVVNYGYHMQDAWYREAAAALDLHPDPQFVFIFQEKAAPYLITVCQLRDDFTALGHRRNQAAREIYRDCSASGIWPGHVADPYDIELIEPPRWAT